MSKDELNANEPEIIYIPDEEGNEEEFEVIMKFEIESGEFAGNQYMMVVPIETDEENEDSDEVYAFRYEEDGDDLQLYTIENEKEWDEVEETFNTLVAEVEEEEDK
ncbi:DUF1292 domain-containing protein [Paenibacillus ginsengarvi]|uniref:UPF0473 protein D7M11_20050 n=1 Tax=Paenibacillus ginsengarvi TaxID=400777 RepID=A0A3B0C4I0_9BACL|nr:DUF1292 domain-containing protein [Paenibacillus ginsengarvi]RKN80440.1 DUF1292 domain-containing protein [Paenibacillus ginsengarvi]